MSKARKIKGPVLVTGAAGFIGFHVARRLLELGSEVIGFDNVNDYYDPVLKEARLTELTRLPDPSPFAPISPTRRN
jgi:UDP-glucuronate 4-epimerase